MKTVKSKKILTSADQIRDFLDIGKTVYKHFLSNGLPVVTINGRKYANTDALEAWTKNKFSKQITLEIPEDDDD